MSKAKPKRIIPISDTHAAIGAGAIMSFFVLWALIAGAGDEFVCWIGGKSNLSGWIQAIGSMGAIAGTWWATKTQIQTAAEAARASDELRRIEMTENALHVCTRVHRLAKNTKKGMFRENGLRAIDIGRLEHRWRNLEVTIGILLAKDHPGDVLRLLMDSRGVASIAANACKDWRQNEGVLNISIENDLISISSTTTMARWVLRKRTRDMKAALHARKLI